MASSMAFLGASSSSSSSLLPPRPYDAFLSFRGKDTRDNFTAHLCNALCRKGIHTYMDDKLKGGEKISPALNKVIKESKIAILILSENYASSTWCLDELKKILECREKNQQIVLPVFYKVDPSDVRHQRKSFGEALAKHKSRFNEDILQSWKAALNKVADLSGRHLEKGNESEFINGIVEVVSRMVSPTYLNVAKYPVGIESRVREIYKLLSIGMSDRRMVGIFGVGGIGKTTISKAIYNSIANQFEGKCFLANIRENSKQECGLVQLQETLLFEILGDSSLRVHNVDRGINAIKERLCTKRILLVLDDVDELIQLETLSGELNWFGLRSRIIITTRNKHLLTKIDFTYKMKELDHNEALQLFSRHAFQNDKPNNDFEELTKHVLYYARGLPLVLKVLGSDLYGRDRNHWNCALEKYKRNPHKNIIEKLKISYDGLEESEKNIFLDIACFFKREDKKYVIKILDNCGFFAYSSIDVLTDKSLITIDEYDRLDMHDLLQDMGREIVRRESPQEPGKRSRLWFHEDVRLVLEENMGTNKIEGILVKLPEQGLIRWSSKTFKKMKSLRFFISRNARFFEKPTYLPNELRVLDWAECPFQSLPSNFQGEKLVVWKISNSCFKEPKGFKNMQNLTIMEFSKCKFLTEIPDISGISNLEKLNCFDCKSLVKVDDSVGFLDKLTYLSFKRCSNLMNLPRSFKLRSLKCLKLKYCSSLQNFPEIECEIEFVRDIHLAYTAIKELPSSIVYFTGLAALFLVNCENLMHLPSSLLQLQHLEIVFLLNCPKLVALRTKEFKIPSSTELFPWPPPTNSGILNDGCSSIGLPALETLFVEDCKGLSKSDFLRALNCFSTLSHLSLANTDIVRLPACIKRFVGLSELYLVDCKQLQEILELPPNIIDINARGCVSLESFPGVSKKFQFDTSELPELHWIDLSRCDKMLGNQMADSLLDQVANSLLDQVHVKCYSGGGIIFPGNTIPDSLSHRMDCSYSSSCKIDISGALEKVDEIKGIVFCVIGPILGISSAGLGYGRLRIDNYIGYVYPSKPLLLRRRDICRLDSGHVWMEYFILKYSYPEVIGHKLRVEISLNPNSGLYIRSCGIHLIHKHEEEAKYHPRLTHVDFNFHLSYPDRGFFRDRHKLDRIKRILGGIQPTKRRRDEDDDDDCNLESSYKKIKGTIDQLFATLSLD